MFLKNMFNNLKKSFIRFPLSFVISITSTIFLLLENYYSFLPSEKTLLIVFSLILSFIISIGIILNIENSKIKKYKYYLSILSIGFGVLFYFTTKTSYDNYSYFILTLIGFLGYLFISPFFNKKIFTTKQKTYYNYFLSLTFNILKTIVLGLIFYGLLSLAISSFYSLFEIRGYYKIYSYIAILSFSFLTPIFFLTQINSLENYDDIEIEENIFFTFLIKFIAIPFIILFFLILYSYSVKVLLNFGDWPRGEVAWMVIGFSLFGYLVYIYSYVLDKISFIGKFRKIFPYIVIPQLFMFFYALYLRISQYGLTINRYFSIAFGIFLLLISIYFIISKCKNIIIIPIVLALFSFIISFGPWGVYSLPLKLQYNSLIKNLEQIGVCINSNSYGIGCSDIKPLDKEKNIENEKLSQISGKLDYLCRFDNCKMIKELFHNEYLIIEEKYKKDNELAYREKFRNTHNQIEEYSVPNYYFLRELKLNLLNYEEYKYPATAENKPFLYFNLKGGIYPLDIIGYNKIYDFSYTFDINNPFLEINDLESINIENIIKTLQKRFEDNKNLILEKEDLTFIVNQKNTEYKIIFSSIELPNLEYRGEIENNKFYINGIVLK